MTERPTLVLITGAIASGKTTLAVELSHLLDAPVLSASGIIVDRVKSRGLEPTRHNLQEVGWEWVSTDPEDFAESLLTSTDVRNARVVIIDSIRQTSVAEALRELVSPTPAHV